MSGEVADKGCGSVTASGGGERDYVRAGVGVGGVGEGTDGDERWVGESVAQAVPDYKGELVRRRLASSGGSGRGGSEENGYGKGEEVERPHACGV